MRFIVTDPVSAAAHFRANLQSALHKHSVLWLVSGGSNVAVTVSVMAALPDELTHRLTVMPVDERFGPPGHDDSNWRQLIDAGFSGKQARLLPVLKEGQTLGGARLGYEQMVGEAFATNDISIAQLGMGSDGHIAGLLPGSPPLRDNKNLVAAYEAPPYRRLTLTFKALQRVTMTYVFAFGSSKRQPLHQLHDQKLAPGAQPAQFLKQLAHVTLYNDQLGEPL